MIPWDLIRSAVTLFVIMDSLGSLPVFWYLTKGLPEEKRNHLANRTFFIATIVLFVFLFFGLHILDFFGVTFGSFKIAGGIVVVIMGIRLVIGQSGHEDRIKNYEEAILPLATPLLVGPGVITTAILIFDDQGAAIAILSAIIALVISWLIFHYARDLMSIFGRQGSDAISRLMGMIIITIAVQLIRDGWAMV